MSRNPLRFSTIGRWHAANTIPEAEVFRRTLAAVRTLKKLPSGKIQSVRSNWPREFEFHGEAIKAAVFAGAARDDKKFKRLRARDFDDLHLGPPPKGDEPPEVVRPATAAEITDAEIAGAWFAKLALMPENAAEFRSAVERYRIGRASNTFVADQIVVALMASGWGPRAIGEHDRIKLTERQAERLINEISRNLWRIANGTARIISLEPGRPADVTAGVRKEACRAGA
jgi:hypothetical protein